MKMKMKTKTRVQVCRIELDKAGLSFFFLWRISFPPSTVESFPVVAFVSCFSNS
jgi:hypothetical protein